MADENGKANARQQRDGEVEAIAEMCARVIGSESIRDQESDEQRPGRAGDIALLAPTGSDLWRYEEALERRGTPVACGSNACGVVAFSAGAVRMVVPGDDDASDAGIRRGCALGGCGCGGPSALYRRQPR